MLPLDINSAHIDDTVEPEPRTQRRGGDAMLAGAGLGDDPLLAHATGDHDLAEHVVDLVRTGVVQLLALEIDLGAAEMFGEALGEIQRRRPAEHLGGIRVSATKRPPKMPKCPRSSGPLRKELSRFGFIEPSTLRWRARRE